ncbi:hypothetical protein [Glutamicibacter uratoxydans]|uniref:hypothetical protein n=1 Tax=Glutamicibacter uratoxydans TaxID=43667 RepID=UPI003D6E9DCB
MPNKVHGRHRLWRPIGGLVTAAVVILAAGSAAAADENTFTSPDNAEVLWIDVEASNLDASTITGTITSDDFENSLEFRTSPSGVTAVLDQFPQEFSLTLSAPAETSARLAVTFATAQQAILSEEGTATIIPAQNDQETPKPEPTSEPDPDQNQTGPDSSDDTPDSSEDGTPHTGPDESKQSPDSSDPRHEAKDPGNPVVTGASVMWTLGAALALLTVGLGVLVIRRRGVRSHD